MKIFYVNRVKTPSGVHAMTQFTIIEVFGWALRLHVFYAADTDGFHSHPRSFLSLCIWGGYMEYFWGNPTPRKVGVGTITVRSATDTHRVAPLHSPTITIAIAAPVSRRWSRALGGVRILLCGLPGSGKGTQGKMLADRYGCPHISIGDEVRRVAANPIHPLHSRVTAHIASSEFAPLPDELAAQIAADATAGLTAYVLDGFPRNVAQARLLNVRPTHVLFLHISQKQAMYRVLHRGRAGDTHEKLIGRLEIEATRLNSLARFYPAHININGEQPIKVVFAECVWAIEGSCNPATGSSVSPKTPTRYRDEKI